MTSRKALVHLASRLQVTEIKRKDRYSFAFNEVICDVFQSGKRLSGVRSEEIVGKEMFGLSFLLINKGIEYHI